MKVFLNDRESFDSLLRRFKRKAERAGIVTDYRKKDFYEKPAAVRRKKKEATLRKVSLKNQRDLERFQHSASTFVHLRFATRRIHIFTSN